MAHQRLHHIIINRHNIAHFGGVKMADQLIPVPPMQSKTGFIGNNHITPIGMVRINHTEIKGDMRRRTRTNR